LGFWGEETARTGSRSRQRRLAPLARHGVKYVHAARWHLPFGESPGEHHQALPNLTDVRHLPWKVRV
jgi:hypothetical protein